MQHRHITDKEWSSEEVVNEVLVSSRGRGQKGVLLGTGQEGSVGRGQKVMIGGNLSEMQEDRKADGIKERLGSMRMEQKSFKM